MFKGLTVAAWFATSVFFITSSATADPYKWCAAYGTPGGTNFGFLTIEQCRATLSGNGGFCEPNQFYTGPETTRETLPKASLVDSCRLDCSIEDAPLSRFLLFRTHG